MTSSGRCNKGVDGRVNPRIKSGGGHDDTAGFALSRRGHQQHAAAAGARDRVVHAGACEMIVAGAEHEIVEGKVAGQKIRLFVVVVLVRGEFRAGLRADQEARRQACPNF